MNRYVSYMNKSKEELLQIVKEYGISHGSLAREWLMYEYLPSLFGRTLFVGVNSYTKFYSQLTPEPTLFETIDIDDDRGRLGGSEYKHMVGNFNELDVTEHQYDNICLFGIHGYTGFNIYNDKVIEDLIYADKLLSKNGTLLWGPTPEIDVVFEGTHMWYEKFIDEMVEYFQTELNYDILQYITEWPDNVVCWMKRP